MICRKCGKKIEDNAMSCKYCGTWGRMSIMQQGNNDVSFWDRLSPMERTVIKSVISIIILLLAWGLIISPMLMF